MLNPRQILVTSALPYANGDIHLGHLVEYIQTDIWVRFQKMRQHQCWYMCADDTHGTPIMLKAENEGIAPEQLIERMRSNHLRDFTDFAIAFDHYHTTHCPENKELAYDIYQHLQDAGLIDVRMIEQFYDPKREMFLPDRFVKGICPRCQAIDQYSDSCEQCGATYAPFELIDPYSTLSGKTPEIRSSEHYFFKLSDQRCRDFLLEYTQQPGRLQPEARNKISEWLQDENGLSDWDISRDAPYFGFEIPGTTDKFFYVWLDAPIGYFACFSHFIKNNSSLALDVDTFIKANPEQDTELYHFIGKDILYFHALFWPAMLQMSQYRTPTAIFAHGFLTVDGQKMSKSRGTFITARSYIEQGLDSQWLRYYYAAKLNDSMEDIDLNLNDFMHRVNADLVGKYVNIASRTAGFIVKRFDGALLACDTTDAIYQQIVKQAEDIANQYERRAYSHAIRAIMQLVMAINQYLDTHKPWELAKDPEQQQHLHRVTSQSLHYFRQISVLLAPVVPDVANQVAEFLRCPALTWGDIAQPLPAGHTIGKYKHLMKRLEQSHLDQLIAANKETSHTPDAEAVATAAEAVNNVAEPITIDTFGQVDLRIGQVLSAEVIEESDKLMRLSVDLGEAAARTIIAGIRRHYSPTTLIGKQVLVVANLKPRKMRFGTSHGMVLAAVDDDQLRLLAVDGAVKPGTKVS